MNIAITDPTKENEQMVKDEPAWRSNQPKGVNLSHPPEINGS